MTEDDDNGVLIGSAIFPELPPGNYRAMPKRAWGNNVTPAERAAIEEQDGTAAKLASGEIVEDAQGNRFSKVSD